MSVILLLIWFVVSVITSYFYYCFNSCVLSYCCELAVFNSCHNLYQKGLCCIFFPLKGSQWCVLIIFCLFFVSSDKKKKPVLTNEDLLEFVIWLDLIIPVIL